MKYSKQRELVLNTIRSSTVHPTAEMIYDSLKKDNPELSLGTVYRNLAQLTRHGMICRIGMPDSGDRYDANTMDHSHLVCQSCGKIVDIPLDKHAILNRAESESGCSVYDCETIFRGLCRECSHKS